MWILGNDYRNKSPLHGAYPPNFLRRVVSMFPDAWNVLHLFSGSLTKEQLDEVHGEGVRHTRFDLRRDGIRDPDVKGDAEKLSSYFLYGGFDLVIADPPYTDEDAQRYGTPMVNRNKVVQEVSKKLRKGGHLVWLDQVLPMYRKDELHMWGAIGLVRSTNHRFRVVGMFEKL